MTNAKDALLVSNYFFVINKNKIYRQTFESSFTNKTIAVTSFAEKKEADVFKRLLASEGLEPGVDYVDGIYDGNIGLAYYPNDWLMFEEIEGKCYVHSLQ